jgi:hypothetical protein
MAWKGIDVWHKLRFFFTGTGATHAFFKGNHKAPVAALIGAYLKQAWFNNAVKANPVKSFHRVKKLA